MKLFLASPTTITTTKNTIQIITLQPLKPKLQSYTLFPIQIKLPISPHKNVLKITSKASSFSSSSVTSATQTASDVLVSTTGTQHHWMVIMKPPPKELQSKPEIVDFYAKTLVRVLGSEKEAQMCIYDVSWKTHFGFCCDIDEKTSQKLACLPEVLSVKPDLNIDSTEKDYSVPNIQFGTLFGSNGGSSRLFTEGTSKYWLVRVDKPTVEVVTKAQMVDYYARILTKVLGNEKDAQMCIYHMSWQNNLGFCCELDEECALQLAGERGVLSVQPDQNFGSYYKDYGGESGSEGFLAIGPRISLDNFDRHGNDSNCTKGRCKEGRDCTTRHGRAAQNALLASAKSDGKSQESADAQEPPIKTKRLFVTGLSFYTSEKTLRAAFEDFGELVQVKIIMDKISKRSKGYAFIEYTTEEAAAAALKEMDGKIINGWMIVVAVAKTNPSRYNKSSPSPRF